MLLQVVPKCYKEGLSSTGPIVELPDDDEDRWSYVALRITEPVRSPISKIL